MTAVAAAAFGLVACLLRGYGYEQAMAGAIFAATVVLWITEVIPMAVTALTATCLLVLLGVSKPDSAFGSFGDPVILLFVGSFLLAKAMSESRLDVRLSYLLLSRRFATRSPGRLLFTLGLIACVISLFVSNTAVTAMMLPIGVGLLSSLKTEPRSTPYSIAVMLMLTWGSSVAVGVIVGTPPNLIAAREIELAGQPSIGFGTWMGFAMPVNAIMLVVAWAILMLMYGRGAPVTREATEDSVRRLRELGPMPPSQRNTLFAFLVTLGLWMLPDGSAMVLGTKDPTVVWLNERLSPTVAALIGAALLFFLPAKDAPSGRTLSWQQGRTIDWGTILLFGGGIALGKAVFDTGLAHSLGKAVASASGVSTVWEITALCIVLAIVMSEIASNTASATTIVPVAIGLAQGAGVSPVPPALGAALGASFGFMLPISTPPNAIVYSSGLVPPRAMAKAGFVLDICGAVVIWACLRVVLPMMGLA